MGWAVEVGGWTGQLGWANEVGGRSDGWAVVQATQAVKADGLMGAQVDLELGGAAVAAMMGAE